MRKLFNTPKEYKEWERYCWSEYGIDLNEDHFVNFSIGIDFAVSIILIVIGNIIFKLSILYIPAWIAISFWIEFLYEYIVLDYIPKKEIKRIDAQRAAKKAEKEAKAAQEQAVAAQHITYDEIISIIGEYANKSYPAIIKDMCQDFFSQLIMFVTELSAHKINPDIYMTFFKNHFIQIFDILSNGNENSLGNNKEVAANLIKNLAGYIEQETKRVCSEKELDEIATLQAFSNFYAVGEQIKKED